MSVGKEMINKISRYNSIKTYITKDGSEIRELIQPEIHGNKNLSLAEARVKPGGKTEPHFHKESEEIYQVVSGEGILKIENETYEVGEGVSVVIMPGQVHSLENTGKNDLVVICCCAPAYRHDDTKLVE